MLQFPKQQLGMLTAIVILVLFVSPGNLVVPAAGSAHGDSPPQEFSSATGQKIAPATALSYVVVNQSVPIQRLGMAWGGEAGTAGSFTVFTGGNGIWEVPIASPGTLLSVPNTGTGYWQLAAPDGGSLMLGGTAYGCPGGVRLGEIYGNNGSFQDLTRELPTDWTQSGPCRDLETMSYGGGTTLMVEAKNNYQNTQVGALDNGSFTNLTAKFNLYPCCYNYFSAYGNGTFLVVTSGSGYLYRPSTGTVTNVSSVLTSQMNNGLGQARMVQYYGGDFLIGYAASLVAYNVSTDSVTTLFTVAPGGGQTAFVSQVGYQTYLGVQNGSQTWIYNSSGSGFHLLRVLWGMLSDLQPSGQNLVIPGTWFNPLEGVLYDLAPSRTVINISATGLPSGTNWSAEVDCQFESGTGSVLSFSVIPNSTYAYSIRGTPTYFPSPSSGVVSAIGSTVTVSVRFIRQASSSTSTSTSWQAVGPHQITGGVGGTSTSQIDGPVCGTLQATGEVQAIAVDPSNPQLIYVSGGGWIVNSPAGIARTENGGVTWIPVDNGLSDRLVNSLWIDPANTTIVLAGTLYGGIYRTQNSGANWSLVEPGLAVNSIVGFKGDVYAAAGGPQGILRSTDGGKTWTDTWSGMSGISGPQSLATNGIVLYAGTGAQGGVQGAVYWTTNGLNWTREPAIVGSIVGLAASYANASTVYAAINPGGVYTNTYAAVSHDRGATWTNLTLPSGWAQPVVADPNYLGTFYVGTDGTFYSSSNNGTTFQEANLGGVDLRTIVPLVGHPGTLFVGADQGIYETVDDGANWTSLAGNLNFSLTYSVAVHNSSLFASMQDFSPVDSFNGGGTWSTTSGFEGGAVYINPLNPSYVYSLTGGGFQFSDNGGANFTSISINVNGGNQNLDPIAVDPNNSLRVYVAGVPGVYVSNNGGSTFSLEPWPFTSNLMVVVDPASNQTLFVSNATGTWVTRNGGSSWTPVSVANGGVIWSLTIDPADPLIMAATTTNAYSEVVRSVNGGTSFTVAEQDVVWNPFPTGFSLRSISFSPTGKYLVVTTATGIYLSLDAGLSWGDIAYNATATYFTGLAWDQGYLYASTYGEGILRLQMGNATYYPVQFTATGLPGGAPWYVTFLGNVQSTTASNMTFLLPNGTYSYATLPGGAWNTGEYFPQSPGGSVVINGGGATINVVFPSLQSVSIAPSSTTCPLGQSVTFNASALSTSGGPITWGTGWNWSVTAPSLGTLNTTEGGTVRFAAGGMVGNLSLFVNATYNGRTLQSLPAHIQIVALSRTYDAQFNESGLPGGASWSVTLSGKNLGSTTSTILFSGLSNNSTGYSFVVGSSPGYSSSPSSGVLRIQGANVSQSITFSPIILASYNVTFGEAGLPTGTPWWVNLTNGQTFGSMNGTISFSEHNGTYGYVLASANKTYQASGGNLFVKGSAVSLSVTFSRVAYAVTFTESGLPSGGTWYLNITGGPSSGPLPGTTSTFQVDLVNGSYSYTVATANKTYQATGGNLIVNGSAASVSVTFLRVAYTVTFTESGLPSGGTWYLNITGGLSSGSLPGTTPTFQMDLVNGSYSYTVATADKIYQAPGGSFAVGGAAAAVSVTFGLVLYRVTFTESGLPSGGLWYVNFTSGISSGPVLGAAGSYTLNLTNGSYVYSVSTNDKTFQAPGGAATVNGNARVLTVTFVQVSYAVVLTESGLPSSTAWWVNLTNGQTFQSTNTSNSFREPNGTYAFRISTSDKTYQALGGSFSVQGGSVVMSLAFAPVTYAVTFNESGLPTGDLWYVNTSTGASSGPLPSGTTSYSETLVNGSYTFRIATNDKKYEAPDRSFQVNGSPMLVSETFSPVTYLVTFSEIGLPSGVGWSVNLSGRSAYSVGNSVSFTVTNGTYLYVVNAPLSYTSRPLAGLLNISGKSNDLNVTFSKVTQTQPTYSVVFHETGLPAGASWSVTLNRVNVVSSNSLAVFTEANGTYAYSVSGPSAYTVSPSSASVTVNGNSTIVDITFTSSSPASNSAGLTAVDLMFLVLPTVILLVLLGIGRVLRRRGAGPSTKSRK